MADEALKVRLRLLRRGLQAESETDRVPCSPSSNDASCARHLSTKSSEASIHTNKQTHTTDQKLFERLRNLHSATPSPTHRLQPEAFLRTSTTQFRPTKPRHSEQDEIDALIQSTRDELEVERSTADDVLGFHDADPDPDPDSVPLSDSESERDDHVIAREAEEIVNAVYDELALESRSATAPSYPDADNTELTEPGQPTMLRSNPELESALADASQDSHIFTSSDLLDQTTPTVHDAGRPKGRRNWLGGRFFLVAMLSLLIVAVSYVPTAHAFGAGNIPSFAYMEGKAFRHGDIEDILEDLAKKVGGSLFGSSKFGGLDIKRTYFGNWLRDYSQAMDVAALQKMSKQAILNIVMVLGFLAHGYATAEFQVTDERLGVYLPEEHLDNPKGYADGKDAREFDPRLREPVNPQELEIDPRSGMKNYLANENQGWRTGSGLIRRTLVRVIETGRQARQTGRDADLYEAYRLLGQALHTLEDFPAHSNWTELALHRLGHHDVFLHVGDNVKVRAPDGTQIAPIVTGTFGSADFIHSLLGEAQDHLSEASISDLNKAIDDAKAKSSGSNRSPVQDLLGMLSKVPGAGGDSVSRDLNDISRGPSSDPANMSPQEMYANLWKILELRDRIMKRIEATLEKIPGLNALVEKLTNELNIFVFTLIEPYAKPIMQQGMSALKLGSGAVINKQEQFEVFDNPNASDPTHSMLSKDHFGLILNEVAGNVAKIIVRHTVIKVVKAWDDRSMDPAHVADECLAPMFHPYWFNGQAQVQKDMMDYVADWARNHPTEIARLNKQSVRNHTNTRSGKAEPHTHGNDQPTMSSFMGGSNSQAAHHFSSNHQYGNSGGVHGGSSSSSGGGGGSGGGSIGSQMAGYASNYVSNQAHAFVGGHIPGGNNLFRQVGDANHDDSSSSYNVGHRPEVEGEPTSLYDHNIPAFPSAESTGQHDRPSFPHAEPTGHDGYGNHGIHQHPSYSAPAYPPPGDYAPPLLNQTAYNTPAFGYAQPQPQPYAQQQQQYPPSANYGQGAYTPRSNYGSGYGGGY